jgi:hypothetical protein
MNHRIRTAALGVAALLALSAPAWAQSRTFNLVWFQECFAAGGPTEGTAQGAALATLTPAGTGWRMRVSGAAPTNFEAAVEHDGGDAWHVQGLGFSNPCGIAGAPPGPLRWAGGDAADATGFLFETFFQGGRERLLTVGAAAAADVGASFTSPAENAAVSGTTAVQVGSTGTLPGVPLVYRLSVGGSVVGSQTSSTGTASFSWSPGGATGSQSLSLTVADGFGTVLASATRTVSVNGGGGGGGGTTPPPNTGTGLKTILTSPAAGGSVAGGVAVNVWVEGAAAGNKTFILAVDGKTVETRASTGVHTTFVWNSSTAPNGTHTVSATVQDAGGKVNTTSRTVIVNNP